jgi:hypothetical protein
MIPTKEARSVFSPPSARGVCLAAGGLLGASQLLRLAVGFWLGPAAREGPAHSLAYGLSLLATCVLLLALTAIYAHVAQRTGRLGVVAYVTAVLGCVLVAGDWWFETFVVPGLARMAPEVLTAAPSGPVLVGAVTTIGLWTAGWTLFGVALLRSRSVPRAAAIVLICGGLLGPLALAVPYQIPLAVGVAWVGYGLRAT